jgi:hypothetical protein
MGVHALSTATADLAVGAVWLMCVVVTTPDGTPDEVTPTVTVTLPDGSTTDAGVESPMAGVYRASIVTTLPGRYTARVEAGTSGAGDLVANVAAIVSAADMPGLADLRGSDPDRQDPDDLGYLGANSWSDGELQDALDAETAAQRRACAVPAAYPADLREALLRRVWRNLVMRGQPLLTVPGSDDGSVSVVPSADPEVRRLERPWRRLVMG